MRMVGTVLLMLVIATPAAAQPGEPFVVPDGCGDAKYAMVTVNGTQASFDPGRANWHDIDAVTLTARVGGGLDVDMQLCGDVPAPQAFSNGWWVVADVGNSCVVQIGVVDDTYGNPVRSGRIAKDCSSSGTDVLGRQVTTVSTVYDADLPAAAWSVSGKTISWHLTKSQLAPTGSKSLKNPGAYARDGARITETYYGDVFAVNGPGAKDDATSQGLVTLD